MSLDFTAASARLAREMNASETSIAEALIAATAIMHTAAIAQRDVAGAPVAQAQATLLRLNKMTTGLIEVQSEARRAHGHLLDIGREMGATEQPTCPDQVFTTGENSTVRVA